VKIWNLELTKSRSREHAVVWNPELLKPRSREHAMAWNLEPALRNHELWESVKFGSMMEDEFGSHGT
jgi:hypothetical protein